MKQGCKFTIGQKKTVGTFFVLNFLSASGTEYPYSELPPSYSSCREELNFQILEQSLILRGDPTPRTSRGAYCKKTKSGTGKRIAHCIAGSARTLWHHKAHGTIQSNFIEGLGGDYNTFMYIKLDDSRAAAQSLTHHKNGVHPLNAQLGILRTAFKVLAPTTLVVAPNTPPEAFLPRQSGCRLGGFTEANQVNLVGQIDTLRDCFRLVEEYERDKSMRFDWVTRIRPDTSIVRPVPAWCSFETQFSYLPRDLYIDHVGVFSRVQSEGLFLAADQFYGCRGGQINDWVGPKGVNIQAALLAKPPLVGNIKYADIPVVLLRGIASEQAGACSVLVKRAPWVFGRGDRGVKNYTQTMSINGDVVGGGNVESSNEMTAEAWATLPAAWTGASQNVAFSQQCKIFFSSPKKNVSLNDGPGTHPSIEDLFAASPGNTNNSGTVSIQENLTVGPISKSKKVPLKKSRNSPGTHKKISRPHGHSGHHWLF